MKNFQCISFQPESSPRIVRHYPGDIVRDVRNVSGAGDNFASGFAAAAILNAPEQVCMSVGFAAARLALLSDSAVPDKIFNTSHPSWNQKAKYHNIEIVWMTCTTICLNIFFMTCLVFNI